MLRWRRPWLLHMLSSQKALIGITGLDLRCILHLTSYSPSDSRTPPMHSFLHIIKALTMGLHDEEAHAELF